VVPRQQGSERLPEVQSHFFEAHAAHVAEVDDLPVRVGKPLHRRPERSKFFWLGTTRIRIRSRSRKSLKYLVCTGRFGVTTLTARIISQSIHGNSKQPALEAPPLNIINQFGCNCAKHGLRDLFCKFWTRALRAKQPVDTTGVLAHEKSPSIFLAARSAGKNCR
jgi:hypothetical protein